MHGADRAEIDALVEQGGPRQGQGSAGCRLAHVFAQIFAQTPGRRSSVLLVDLDVGNWVAQQRSHFFLNLDDQLGLLELFGQAGVGGGQLAVLRNQRADGGLGAALFGRERIALALRALPFHVVRCDE